MNQLDIAEILRLSVSFASRLAKVRSTAARPELDWYPHDSFGNFTHLDRLLAGERRRLLALAGTEPILDIGCADGAVAFFLESLGCRVQALDRAETNFNDLQGVRSLKEALGSNVEILERDIDSWFELPEPRYGLVLLLGVLYHLKNPFHVLERLSRVARHCLLSTRVTRYTPGGRKDLHDEPVAYLLDPGEASGDWSNFWIFTEAGLRRLLDRTGWRVEDWLLTGSDNSDPSSPDADARVFCCLSNRFLSPAGGLHLLDGWNEIEGRSWRWTRKDFSVSLDVPSPGKEFTLDFHFTIPAALHDLLGPVVLSAACDGVALPSQRFPQPGRCLYRRRVRPAAPRSRIGFWLDKAVEPGERDGRQLGVLVCLNKADAADGRAFDSPIVMY